jgi:hypothetical protein
MKNYIGSSSNPQISKEMNKVDENKKFQKL